MVTVPRRTYLRTTFSSSGSSIGYGSDPRTDTFRYRLLTVRTSTDRARLSPWCRASPKPVMLSSTGAASADGHLTRDPVFWLSTASCLATLMWTMMSSTQMPAIVMVMRVNVSPALDPNELDPPGPPNAPISPPTLPRWIRMVRIISSARPTMTKLRTWEKKLAASTDTEDSDGTRVDRTRASVRVPGGKVYGADAGRATWPAALPQTRDKRHETREKAILVSRVSCLVSQCLNRSGRPLPLGRKGLGLFREHLQVGR